MKTKHQNPKVNEVQMKWVHVLHLSLSSVPSITVVLWKITCSTETKIDSSTGYKRTSLVLVWAPVFLLCCLADCEKSENLYEVLLEDSVCDITGIQNQAMFFGTIFTDLFTSGSGSKKLPVLITMEMRDLFLLMVYDGVETTATVGPLNNLNTGVNVKTNSQSTCAATDFRCSQTQSSVDCPCSGSQSSLGGKAQTHLNLVVTSTFQFLTLQLFGLDSTSA